EVVAGLSEDLDGHVLGNVPLGHEPPDEVELRLRRSGKTHLDLPEPQADEEPEHLELALVAHGLDESLIAVAKIHAAPGRRVLDAAIGPGAIGQAHGGLRAVFGMARSGHGNLGWTKCENPPAGAAGGLGVTFRDVATR